MNKKIKSIQALKNDCNNTIEEYFILLNGELRSYKTIRYDIDIEIFEVSNSIDETEQLLTEEELYTASNIGEAIDNGAFYKY